MNSLTSTDVKVPRKKTTSRFKFSLKTYFVVMTAITVGLGFYWKTFQDRRAAIAAIERLGGTLDFKYYRPSWLRKFVDDEKYFWDPVGVYFNRPLSAAELESVLPSLMSFERLHLLTLPGTTITDDTLPMISPFANKLTFLNLHGSPISDASVDHLKQFRRLIVVCLSDTRLTFAGLAKLHAALPGCTIAARWGDNRASLGP